MDQCPNCLIPATVLPTTRQIRCTQCGGTEHIGPTGPYWEWHCQRCEKDVPPGQLVAGEIPHLCQECEEDYANTQVVQGAICMVCHQPMIRCNC
jgi:hypothetical protein